MYNKKYRLIEIDRPDENKNVCDDMKNSICYLAYLKVGERGWFLYEADDPIVPVHRIHTSVIKDVQYTRGNRVVVMTENTKYVFEVILDDNNDGRCTWYE